MMTSLVNLEILLDAELAIAEIALELQLVAMRCLQ